MRIKAIAPLVAATLVLAACSGNAGQKETAGTIIGGIGGAVLGSQIGGGSGQIVATAIGTFAGALIGNELGKSLDRADQLAMGQAEQRAHSAPIGEEIVWNNPDSGNYGTVTPVREGTSSSSGAYCREYQTTVTVGGRQQEAYGTACQQPDGSWKVVG
ncbi:MAG: RT0821/Lpp0805 family surface protein [Alphaproteobacteria bacterium]|nr:RT0821/Lpp0805 family surface protein [Alphaproteobacteria bacterium]